MRTYRTFITIEELWCKIVSEDCPYSREIVYADAPSESEEDDERVFQDAITKWNLNYKNGGLVPKPTKLYYYKAVDGTTILRDMNRSDIEYIVYAIEKWNEQANKTSV